MYVLSSYFLYFGYKITNNKSKYKNKIEKCCFLAKWLMTYGHIVHQSQENDSDTDEDLKKGGQLSAVRPLYRIYYYLCFANRDY